MKITAALGSAAAVSAVLLYFAFEKSPPPGKLAPPLFPHADGTGVALVLPDRECGKSYVIYRSYDGRTWEIVGTAHFPRYEQSNDWTRCANSYVDSNVPVGVARMSYKYVLSEQGTESEIGTVVVDSQ